MEATGIDANPDAIERAPIKASARGLTARFEIGDARDPGELDQRFDTVIDSGFFHTLDDSDRTRYVGGLDSTLRPDGKVLLLCLSDQVPGAFGPRRISQADLHAAFADGWEFDTLEPVMLESILPGREQMPAWFASIRRTRTVSHERSG